MRLAIVHRYRLVSQQKPSIAPSLCIPAHHICVCSSPASSSPFDPIQLFRGYNLASRPLAPHGQAHSVSSSPVRAHISQSLDVIVQLPLQVIFQHHFREFLCQCVDLPLFQASDPGSVVNVEARHESLADFGTDAVEGLERVAHKKAFGEVVAE